MKLGYLLSFITAYLYRSRRREWVGKYKVGEMDDSRLLIRALNHGRMEACSVREQHLRCNGVLHP